MIVTIIYPYQTIGGKPKASRLNRREGTSDGSVEIDISSF